MYKLGEISPSSDDMLKGLGIPSTPIPSQIPFVQQNVQSPSIEEGDSESMRMLTGLTDKPVVRAPRRLAKPIAPPESIIPSIHEDPEEIEDPEEGSESTRMLTGLGLSPKSVSPVQVQPTANPIENIAPNETEKIEDVSKPLPVWLKPSWLSQKDEPLPKSFKISIPELSGDITPAWSIKTFDGSKEYLELVGETNPKVKEAVDAIDLFKRSESNKKNKKITASALGLAIAKLKFLSGHPDTFAPRNMKAGIRAVNVLISFLDKEVNNLPEQMQERINKGLAHEFEGSKDRTRQERTSKFLQNWSDVNLIFIRALAIKKVINLGLSNDEAEAKAKEDWNTMVSLVKKEAPDLSPDKYKEVMDFFCTQILGGSTIEDSLGKDGSTIKGAWDIVKKFIQAGGRNQERFKDVSWPEENLEKMILGLMNEDNLERGLEDIPPNIAFDIGNKIEEFAKSCYEFFQLTRNWEPKVGINEDELSKSQRIYDVIAKKISEIMLTPNEYIDNAEEIFGDVYWTFSQINNIANANSIQTSVYENAVPDDEEKQKISPTEHGMTITNPVGKKRERKGRNRNPVANERHQRTYMQPMKEDPEIGKGFYGSKKDYHNRKPIEQKQITAEVTRIRNQDYDRNKYSGWEWQRLLHEQNPDPQDIEFTKNADLRRTVRIYKHIKESWLPDKGRQNLIDGIIASLTNFRIKFYNKLLNSELVQVPPKEGSKNKEPSYKWGELRKEKLNPVVVKVLQQQIAQVPDVFRQAEEITKDYDPKKKFEPGETRRTQEFDPLSGQIRFRRRSELLNMVNFFVKCAMHGRRGPSGLPYH